jgi:copper(I)-binding protein
VRPGRPWGSGIIERILEEPVLNKLWSLCPTFVLAACVVVAYTPRALAQHDADAPLIATDAWVRAIPGSDVAAAYVTLRNVSRKPVTLVSVESPVAGMAMIHETTVDGGISRMRRRQQLVIPPGGTVKLEPGGLHVMLHGIGQPLAPGASVPLVLRLADGTALQIVALVRPLNAQ